MTTQHKVKKPLGAFGVAVLLFATMACGGASTGGDSSTAGDISIDGSSTVAPLTEAIAEEYRAEAPEVDVTVATSGTGGGFAKFCAGETDISNASRAISEEEAAACEKSGVTYEEIRVGLDGVAVVTSAETDFVDCLSFDHLRRIWGEPGAQRWSDVDPSFPDEALAVFAPDAESGTYDFFNEEVLGDPDEDATPEPRTRYTASADDNVLVRGIAGEANSWGFFGFAYFQENEESLRAIAVKDDSGDCVKPSEETIATGDYPLSRPLFIYVTRDSLEQEHVRDFVTFYLETTPEVIEEVGYVPAPEEDYEKGLQLIG